MDHQKTGALIATRRGELGLTQKELAKQLNISDRTISKWERGVGFPDISLLEPLADVLGLTLLELFRGERAPEPERNPEKDKTVRETVQALRPAIINWLKKAKLYLIILSSLLIITVAVVLFFAFYTEDYRIISLEPIPVTEAIELCPDILITTEEFELRDLLWENEAVTSFFADDTLLELDDSLTGSYRNMVSLNNMQADTFRIDIIGHNIYVDYSFDEFRSILFFCYDGSITKTCSQTRDSIYAVENRGNASFSFCDFR